MSDNVIIEFGEDGALDERDNIIDQLIQRTDEILQSVGYSSSELASARANIALLRTIIREHGGGYGLTKSKVSGWLNRMLEVFTNPKMWDFAGSNDEENAAWKSGCEETVSQLIELLEE